MSQYDPKKIEEMQLVLLNNPRSPVFAGLAEAYRKMNLLEEALEVTTKGVRHNPEYVTGLVAHSKILYELKDYTQAVEFLNKAHLLNPDNILALRLLGLCLVKMRRHRDALKAFKKLLINKPDDEKALSFIKKWEFLDNLPKTEDGTPMHLEPYTHWIAELPSEEHVIHILDSFMSQGDNVNALEIANMATTYWPDSKDIKKRQTLLLDAPDVEFTATTQQSPALDFLKKKRAFYQRWLRCSEKLLSVDP